MKVSYTKLFEKGFAKCPRAIQDKILLWIKTVESAGIREVRKRPGYHDEPLKGKLRGRRSARMSRSYRLIYVELVEGVHLELIEVHKHDY